MAGLAGCADDGGFQRETLFELEVGMLDQEMNLFQQAFQSGRFANRMTVRDGSVYIANGNGNKVMTFTGRGDLVRLVYDPERNPVPVRLGSPEEGATRGAVPYAFREIGEIAVTPEHNLYVADRVESDRAFSDDDLGVRALRVIRRFDETGQYREYLGREGIGGTPFTNIESLTAVNGELVVVARTAEGRKVYWYDRENRPVYQVELEPGVLPEPPQVDGRQTSGELSRVYPDPQKDLLYISAVYYPEAEGAGSVEDPKGRVYVLDLEQGEYTDSIEVPREEFDIDNSPDTRSIEKGGERVTVPRFLGVGPEGNLFFLGFRDQHSARLVIRDASGQVVERRSLELGGDRLVDLDFTVSPEGALYALIAREDGVEVAWWRTDRVLR